MSNDPIYTWSHQKEAEAESFAKASPMSVRVDGGYSSDASTAELDASDGGSNSEGSGGTDEDEDLNPWEVEEYYRDLVRKWFKTEVKAYQQLRSLQGVCVPKFFGTVFFDHQSLCRMPAGILTEVPGILLEFIEGSR
jgi:hypothetical protein